MLRSTFLYQATDDLHITSIVEGGAKDGDNIANKLRGIIDPQTGETCSSEKSRTYTCADILGQIAESKDITEVNNNLVMDHKEDFLSATVRLDWQLSDNISLVSISNHMALEAFQADDTDASPLQLLELFLDEESKQFTQEFQLLGQYDDTSWVLGAYYLKDSAKANHDYAIFQEFAPILDSLSLSLSPEQAQEALGDLYGLAGSTGVFNEIYDQEVESLSIFGQYERRFNEKWNLTLGIRYTDEKSTMKLDTALDASFLPYDVSGDGIEDIFLRGEIPVVAQDEEVSDSNVSGKIGLNYQLQDNILLYSSISTAFKAPGFNTSAVFSQNEAQSFDSEEMTAVEFGIKSDLLDNQLRINASIFTYDYKDMQVYTTRTTDSGVPARFIDNAAKGEYQGAELEVITMLTDDLRLQVGLSYIDVELKNFLNVKGIDPISGEAILEDLSGVTTAFTPEKSANIMLNYYWEIAEGELDWQVDYNWQDDVFHSTANDPYAMTEAYGLLNTRLMWTNSEGNLSLSAWAKNITDEKYISYSSELASFGLMNDLAGLPRTFGVSVSYNFE
jgi:iron complex outermembrane receptor protein